MNTPTSALIKEMAALRQKKGRDDSDLILVEGRHPIEEAIRAGLTLRHIFVMPTHPAHLPTEQYAQVPYQVHEKAMRRLCTTDSPPPCLAIFERPAPLTQFRGSFALILDSIQDPGNLGTLIRSAIAFGVDGVILTGDMVEPYNPKVIRSSAGLLFSLPLYSVPQEGLSQFLPEADWKIYATTGHTNAQHYREADYTGRCAIVLGNEGRGVSQNLLSDRPMRPLTIPMAPKVESLNVAISGSIILAEAAARRTKPPIGNAGTL